MAIVSLGRTELQTYAANEFVFFGLDINRLSSVFIVQIMQLRLHRHTDTFQILDEVKYLEGLSSRTATRKHDRFKKMPLKGLYKKHFMNAAFVLPNIASHFGFDFGGNSKLDKVINDAFSANETGYIDDDFINKLSHDISIGAIEERAQAGLTGEWIVFQEHQGIKYYLTLASHKESDDDIFDRVKIAYDIDFEFLKEIN